ncbi:MAG TPA: transposase [Terriglobales bacterium]|jgi:REP element-mobilizing transposase RayT
MPIFQADPYNYRRRLPHLQKTERALFVTFCKLNHEPFPPSARDLILHHCLHDDGRRYTLHAALVMPEHVHLLFTALQDSDGWPYELHKIMKLIEGTSARSVNKLMKVEGPVWQEKSFDHVLRSHGGLLQKAEYIRQNPVRRGLVKQPGDYRWLWMEPTIKAQML